MQYTININQEKLADTKLDIIEASILEYLYHYCSSVSQKIEKQRLIDDSGVWTWIDYEHLVLDMPLLRIKDKGAISRRIQAIQNEGFIKSKKGAGFKLYIKLTDKCDGLYRKVESEPALTDNKPALINNNAGSKETLSALTINNASVDEKHFSIYNTNTNNSNTIVTKVTRQSHYGNAEVTKVLEHLKKCMELPKLDLSEKINRQYAWTLIKKSKTGAEGVCWLIDLAASDPWHKNHITSVRDLWNNQVKILSSVRGAKKEVAIYVDS